MSKSKLAQEMDDLITSYWDFESDWRHAKGKLRKRARDGFEKRLTRLEQFTLLLHCALGNHTWVFVGRDSSHVGEGCCACGKLRRNLSWSNEGRAALKRAGRSENEIIELREKYQKEE